MQRLSEEHQFLDSVSSTADSAEIQFWDEGENMLDVASLAMRLWNEHRESANLPRWEVVGLEVVEKDVREGRTSARPTRLRPPWAVARCIDTLTPCPTPPPPVRSVRWPRAPARRPPTSPWPPGTPRTPPSRRWPTPSRTTPSRSWRPTPTTCAPPRCGHAGAPGRPAPPRRGRGSRAMAQGLRDVAGLPDPVGEVVRGSTLANGLQLRQVRVPFGVVGIIYEARPNVTADAAGHLPQERQRRAAARLLQRPALQHRDRRRRCGARPLRPACPRTSCSWCPARATSRSRS